MAVWSTSSLQSIIDTRRVDADHYRPEYLKIADSLSWAKPLKYFTKEIIHPAEFPRKYSSKGWNVIRAQNVRPLRMEFESNEVLLPDEIAVIYKKNHLVDEDILITRTGANFGQCSLFYTEDQKSIATSHTFILRTKNIDSAYLALFLNTTYGRQMIDRGRYGSSQPEIAPRYLFRIPVPRFSAKVEIELSDMIRGAYKLRKSSTEKYELARHLFETELEIDQLNLHRSKIYTSNASEVSTSLRSDAEYYSPVAKEISRKIKSLPHSILGQNFFVKNGFPWSSSYFLNDNSGEPVVRIRNIRPNHINPADLTSIDSNYACKFGVSKAKSGDVMIGMDGIKYFYASILTGESYVNQRVAHLSPKPSNQVSAEYVTFIINNKVGQIQLMRDMTIATTVGHITNRDIKRLVIPTVSRKFHDQISDLVRQSIDAKEESKRLIEKAKTKLEQLIEQAVQA